MGLCGKEDKGEKEKTFVSKKYKRPKINLKEISAKDMQAIPQSLEDLHEIPVYINMKEKTIVDEMIKETDVLEQAFREIFIGDEESAIQSMGALQRDSKW